MLNTAVPTCAVGGPQDSVNYHELTLILGFRCDVDEICAFLGYYTASRGNSLPTSRNVGKQLPHDAV